MRSKHKNNGWAVLGCTVFMIAWILLPFSGFLTSDVTATLMPCPNGPLAADLSGSATGGVTPAGTARYREKGSNRLMVNLRSVNVGANTNLDVYIGETKVGTISIGRGGTGQLRVDSPTVTIDENTTISVRNGATTLLTGTFACVAGGPQASPTASPTGSPTASPSVSPTVSPSVSPTMMPTASPTASPTMAPKTKPD